MACEVADAAKVGKLILFHHDPAYDDNMIDQIEREARKMFENSVAAYEGLEVSVHASTRLSKGEERSSREARVKYVQDGRD
jgi:hypothetical protein